MKKIIISILLLCVSLFAFPQIFNATYGGSNTNNTYSPELNTKHVPFQQSPFRYESDYQNGEQSGWFGAKVTYEGYCAACEKAGVKPLPRSAWSNGQWAGHPNLFHPHPAGPTGYEELYWSEHAPIDMDALSLIVFSLTAIIYMLILKVHLQQHNK